MEPIRQTPGAKMLFLIRRRPETTRDELVAHWFANHMPLVIARQAELANSGRNHASKYYATLFEPNERIDRPWDGVAHLYYEQPWPRRPASDSQKPTDMFQAKAEPYTSWGTREYVVMDGDLDIAPNDLNEPYPSTRSGFFKVTFLVAAKDGADLDAFFSHWLDVHVPNVRATMEQSGGFRYVVSHSLEPEGEAFAGMAELYFPDEASWRRYREIAKPDGMEQWVDAERMQVMISRTEMVGIP